MVHKIDKALKRLSKKERAVIKQMLLQIKKRNIGKMDIKKLKGRTDIYRARNGSLRIIFFMNDDDLRILSIERRNDTTYS